MLLKEDVNRMSQHTVKGSAELGNKIRQRWNELGLTIYYTD